MWKPQVTITLGSSGRKVVKRPLTNSDGFVHDHQTVSGSKRSLEDRNADDFLFSTNKRLKSDGIWMSSSYSGPGDVKVGGNDLRLKLLRNRMDKQMKMEEQKKIEQQGKFSKTIQSPERSERILMRNIPPSRRAGELLEVELLRNSYNSHSMDKLTTKSPDDICKISGGISSSRSIDEVLRLPPPRPIDASRSGYRMHSDLLEHSHPKGSESMPVITSSMRTSLDMDKPVKAFTPSSSIMLKSTVPDKPLTVSSLLHSLGLGKYIVLFQAEEVDMAALKQMGDRDLKELGIPMGPRKKILLAMLARSKRPTA